MKRILSRVLALLMAVTLFSGLTSLTGTAAALPDHVIINQVYGPGNNTDGAALYGFIELYNPTGADVNLDTYAVQYTSGTGAWSLLPLTGNTIKARCSFLICATRDVSAIAALDIPRYDLAWENNQRLNNSSASYALTDTQTALSNPIAAGEKSHVVDLVGVVQSDPLLVNNYEGSAPKTGISKQKSARRIDFSDTDNNTADFEIITYQGATQETLDKYHPRSAADGPWGLDIFPPDIGTPDGAHLLINQVYCGAAADGAINYSFVELFNPTDSAISLNTYSLQYFQSPATHAGGWDALPLSGTIPARGSFLIVATGAALTGARYVITAWDQAWPDKTFDNRFCSLALVEGLAPLSAALTSAEWDTIVDLAGVRNATTDPAPTYYEGAGYVDGISKQKSARRIGFADTNNNNADFTVLDYRASGISDAILAEVKPRTAADGSWGGGPVIPPDPGTLPDHVIINQVYGSGPPDDSGAMSHSFVELYNPTDSPASLAGWSLQLQNGKDKDNEATEWEKFDFNSGHVIAPHGYFLIRLAEAAPSAYCRITQADVDWTAGRVFSNRAYSVALVSNQTLLSKAVSTAQQAYIVDLLGALNTAPADDPLNFEEAPVSGMSKQKSVRRKNFQDTGNNAADFEVLDYRDNGIGEAERIQKGPRFSGGVAWEYALPAELPDHVIINQAYGSGPLDDSGAISHSFIELFNPTDSPINLAGWSLQLQNGTASGVTPTEWERYNFSSSHVIAPHGYFLVRLAEAAPNAYCQIVHADVEWTAGRVLSNRSYSIALSKTTTLLSRNITAAQMANVVDLIGALNTAPADAPLNYEETPVSGISKQKSARRKNFQDTGSNLADFEVLDYRDTGISEAQRILKGPRWSGGAAWATFVPIPEDQRLVFSHDAGLYEEPFSLEMATPYAETRPGAVIRYTTNGSDPTSNSTVYTAPIAIMNRTSQPNDLSMRTNITAGGMGYTAPSKNIAKGNVIKAQLFSAEGTPLSRVYTRSYFVGLSYPNLPVVSVVSDVNNFYGSGQQGLFVNSNFLNTGSDWERPAHLEVFETDGAMVISQDIGVRIHGAWTKNLAKKALRLYASNSRDPENPLFTYDIFQGRATAYDGTTVNSFRRMILRASGNDNLTNYWCGDYISFRDALIQRLFHDTNTPVQAERQCVMFLDGEFWGIYNFRERYDEYYMQDHYKLPDAGNVGMLTFGNNNNVPDEILETPADILVRSDYYDSYLVMWNWFGQHANLSNANDYAVAQTFLDVDNFIDYFISNIYCHNGDWPGNNHEMWRCRTDGFPAAGTPNSYTDGRWRWITKDLDWGMGSVNTNTINWLWNREGDTKTPEWAVRIYKCMMTNAEFHDKFISRFCDLLNTNCKSSVVTALIDEMTENVRPTMQDELDRWRAQNGGNGSISQWNGHISNMKNFANNRPNALYNAMRNSADNFLGLSGASTVTLTTTVNNAACGYVKVNSIDILPATDGVTNPDNWSGTYFTVKTQTITAVSRPGYMFVKFIVNGVDSLSNPLNIVLTGNTTVQAVFAPDDGTPMITITTQPATLTNVFEGNISGSLTIAAGVTQYGLPAGTPSYQWYGSAAGGGNTAPIPGATGTDFAIPAGLTEGTYFYFCEVSFEGANSAWSNVATVIVKPIPIFGEGLPPDGAEIVLVAARNGMIVQSDPTLFYSDPANAGAMTANQSALTEANLEYCSFTVMYYASGDPRVFLRAKNGRNVTIDTAPYVVRPRSVPPNNPDGFSTLRFTLQADGTFKIHRSSTGQGTYYVDVDANGDLVTVTSLPGDTGKFNWKYAVIQPAGVQVSGLVKSYNPSSPATVKLMQGGVEKYSAAITALPGFGQAEQNFAFTGVLPGTYSLVITKPGHTSFTVQTVTVGNTTVDLTQDGRDAVKCMTLLCGDINGDQMINDNDLIVLWQAANYNKSVEQAANPLCDLNGDGVINDNDLIILWLAVNYNKGPVEVP